MINIIVPITEKVEDYLAFIETKKGKDYKIFVGITKNLADKFKTRKRNVEVHVYKQGSSKEEIINSLHSCQMQKGKIMILRRIPTEEEFEKLENSTSDITTLRARKNKFSNFFRKLIGKIIRRVFAFDYFDDISAICYGEEMFELLSVCQNLSTASRINKYIGFETEEIETEIKPCKRDYTKWKSISLFVGLTLFFLGSIAGGLCICLLTPLKALKVILAIFWIALALIFWLVGVVNFMRTLAVGDVHYGRAQEV